MALLLYLFNDGVLSASLNVTSRVELFFVNKQEQFSNFIAKHFRQSREISQLKETLKEHEKNTLTILALEKNIEKLEKLLSINTPPSLPLIYLSKAYAYAKLGNHSQILLHSIDALNHPEGRIFGMVKNNVAAGIAIKKPYGLLGILNTDERVSYGVYVGDKKHPGIFRNIRGKAVVDYIYAWSEINIGDEVKTNGLDLIFFEGIKVGKVKNIFQEYGYLVAELDIYYKNEEIDYFYLVDNNEGKSTKQPVFSILPLQNN